jgi:hypothetical protein
MKVEIFNLCDFASADASGKLNIIGVFDTIWAREKPITYGMFALVARIRFDKIEEGTKKIKISFVDADGNPVMPVIETQLPVRIPALSPTATAQVVSLVSQLKLQSFGEYSVDLAIDGRQEASLPFYVRDASQIPPQFQIPLQS